MQIVKNYVSKGSKLYIEGSLQTRKWVGNDGIEKYTTEIVLQGFNATLQVLDSRTQQQTKEESTVQQKTEGQFTSGNSFDTIPF